ncbi:hypothetical protein [Mycobacterium sp. NAZ190054]|uniref:hypothetical protein n=1 Tax=Mycobacterium sp. NAZ190054 TaxID=1747766 RepID=UPI0012E3A284|nr:hypothetical protein [Mycobacterium sp. NAZ190054]
MAAFVDTISVEKRARSSIRWMSRPGTAAQLRHLASLGRLPTHADLDQLPPSVSLHHLRHLLVYSGVLPDRLEPLERIEPWLDTLLASLPIHHATVIGPYAQWSVLRKARRRAVRRTYTFASADLDKLKIVTAAGFLEWLDSQQVSLQDLSQPLLETWLVNANNGKAAALVGFVAWFNTQHGVDKLEIRYRRRSEPTEFPDPQQQTDTIRTLLSKSCALPTDIRVASLLVLLYGVTISSICNLTVADLAAVKEKTFLVLSSNPVLVPPALASLLNELAANSRASKSATPRYLFPSSKRIGSHISAKRLTKRINDAGVHVRVNRNGALLTLAQDLPAPVLAELLGLHINTASRWCRIAQRDWSHYLSARTANRTDRIPPT